MKDASQYPTALTFDANSAKLVGNGAEGSYHQLFKDQNVSYCLVCTSSSPYGGVAVNEADIISLRERGGVAFIRLMNTVTGWDITIPLEQLPPKLMRKGKSGSRYAYYDLSDLNSPAFPPPLNPDAM